MRPVPIALAFSLLLAPAAARAQDSLAAVQGALSQILGEMEGNLTTGEGVAMNFKDWQARAASATAQIEDINRRYDEANAYCSGTFEEPEYSRRVAACEALKSQLDTLKAQLQPEIESLEAERSRLQGRDTERAAAWQALEGRLSQTLPRLIALCAAMTPDQQQTDCRMPPAPGPRSAEMVAEMNRTLSGAFGQ